MKKPVDFSDHTVISIKKQERIQRGGGGGGGGGVRGVMISKP
jgi:hypothetical protein